MPLHPSNALETTKKLKKKKKKKLNQHIFEGEIQASVIFKIPIWLQCAASVENCCPTARETWSYLRWSIHQDLLMLLIQRGYLGGTSGKESACQCRRRKRHRFNPWVGKIPWRKAWQPTPVFLLGECHAQRNLAGYSPGCRKKSDTTEATEQALIQSSPNFK